MTRAIKLIAIMALGAATTAFSSDGFVFSIHGGGNDERGVAMCADTSGNIYVLGYFEGTANFDPHGTALLSTGGSIRNAFVAKYTAGGNFVWARRVLANLNPDPYALAVDVSNNVYVTGGFTGSGTFDPDGTPTMLTSAGARDIFVCKLNSNGSIAWTKQIGNTGDDVGAGVACDLAGNVHVTGQYSATVDFDPGAGASNIISVGDRDVFILKLDTAGDFVWARSIGGSSGDAGSALVTDPSGNVYIVGNYSATGDADFDPGAGVFLLSGGGGFLCKLNSAGNFIFATKVEGNAFSICRDSTGNIVTSGVGFVSKHTATGSVVWANTSNVITQAMALDSANNIYTTGYFNTALNFDPHGSFILTPPPGVQNIFIQKITGAGNFGFARQMIGTSTVGSGTAIAIDNANGVFTTGYFRGSFIFDLGRTTQTLTSADDDDIFVCRFVPSPVVFPQNITMHAGLSQGVVLTGTNVSNQPLSTGFTIVTAPLHGALSGTPPNVTYTPSSGFVGTDSFTFKVTDGGEDSNLSKITITVTNAGPSASASASPNVIPAGGTTQFSVTSSDPENDALTYSWNFGDGSPPSTEQNPAHTYSAIGDYTATVTVTDSIGASTTASVVVHVGRAPTVRFTTSDIVGFVGQPLAFDATFSTDPENAIVAFNWNFGDGTPNGALQQMSHIYEAEGSYTVTLTVTDAENLSSSLTRQIEVLPKSQLGIFNSFVNYSVKWDRLKTNKDTLTLEANVNVGDAIIDKDTEVAIEIAGKRYEGKLDAKLRDKTTNEQWQVVANTKKQQPGAALLKLKVKKTSLGLNFNEAGAVAAGEDGDEVELDIPVKIEVAGRSFELLIPSEFKFSKSGTRANGSGEGP